MSLSFPRTLPSSAECLELHRRLADSADRIATDELATRLLPHLVDWLTSVNLRVDLQFIHQAAEEALLTLIKNPASFDPDRGDLVHYLQMSSQCDLRNILRREARHHRGRKDWISVEESLDAGKYLGEDDDPSFRLRIAETLDEPILQSVRVGLSANECAALDLVLARERRTVMFAEVLGVTGMSPEEQAQEVKRVKDKIKQRLNRAGWHDDRPD